MKLSDEALMRYADGLLDPSQEERVEKVLAGSPELHARVQQFRATGHELAGLFDEHLNAPIPARLRDALITPDAKRKPAAKTSAAAQSGWRPPARWQHSWRLRLAASFLFMAGLAVGWAIRSEGGRGAPGARDLVTLEGQRLLARASLQDALESQPSGPGARQSTQGGIVVSITMTFQNEAGDYCREYQLTSSLPERYMGVACRAGGQWMIAVHMLTPPAATAVNQVIPASEGASTPINAVVSAMIAGDPIVGDAEAAVLAGHWSK
jgi:hypothetical protein